MYESFLRRHQDNIISRHGSESVLQEASTQVGKNLINFQY